MRTSTPILLALCNLSLFLLETLYSSVQSQSIQIDGTTPTTVNLPISRTCQDTCIIDGGKRQGSNLFHSFNEFNVESGETVLFSDPGVQNILSRVTSKSPSKILGTLGVVGGDANLFLINPNGIFFGPGANLSLNGSFLATTANAIQFGNQGFFSASASEIPNFTINPSALFFQAANGPVENRSVNGLSVTDGNSLHLVGGDVIINNGKINTFGGQVGLWGVKNSGIINIQFNAKDFSLAFPDNTSTAKANVLLIGADIDVTGEGGGNIIISGSNIRILDSKIRLGIDFDSGSNRTQAGDIKLSAEESVQITKASTIVNRTLPGSKGHAGNVIINATNLYLDNESVLSSSTFGEGNAGDVIIQAKDFVSLDSGLVFSNVETFDNFRAVGNGGQILLETNKLILDNESELTAVTRGTGNAGNVTVYANEIYFDNFSGAISSVQEGGVGNGGKIEIYTDVLTLEGGSQLTASVANAEDGLPGGNGQGGNILVEASKSVTLAGFSEVSGESSGIFVATEEGAIGPAGKITVNTNTFRIIDGAVVSAQTLNQSNGGDITINSKNFEALDGGQIVSTTFSAGNAGSIKLNVSENISLASKDINFDRRLNILRDFLIEDGVEPGTVETQIQALRDIGSSSGLYASATSGATGKAGNISVDPRFVLIQDGARISVNNAGSGPGGSIFLQAGNLTLDRGTITATSSSNQGGNIDLLIDNLLFLKNNSRISASAGNENTGGDGGNVTINTDLLVALQNSNITANAFTGRGGNIQITTRGLFLSPDSDITASSERGIDGQVEINNPEVDPSESLTELPESVDPPQDVAQGCRPGQALGGSTFTHVGRGGLPPSPHETQTPNTVWQDLRAHTLQPPAPDADNPATSLVPTPPPSIIEAKGWTKDAHGRIHLTAHNPQLAHSPQPTATTC